MADRSTLTATPEGLWPPRRIALAVLALVAAAALFAPVWLLDAPTLDGRAGLARYRASVTGELTVADGYQDTLRARFDQVTLPDGTDALTSRDADGCWQLTLDDLAGPSPAPDTRCGGR